MGCFSWFAPPKGKAEQNVSLNEEPISIPGGLAGIRERMAEMGHVTNDSATGDLSDQKQVIEGAGFSVSAELSGGNASPSRRDSVQQHAGAASGCRYTAELAAERERRKASNASGEGSTDSFVVLDVDEAQEDANPGPAMVDSSNDEIKSATSTSASGQGGKRRQSNLISADLEELLAVYREEQLMKRSRSGAHSRRAHKHRADGPSEKEENATQEEEGPSYLELARAYGSGLSGAFVGEKGEVFVEVSPECEATLKVEIEHGGRRTKAQGLSRDKTSGLFSCHYVPCAAGDTVVHVRLGGKHVPGSPFKLVVRGRENRVQVYFSTTMISAKARRDVEQLERLLKAKNLHLRPNFEPWQPVDLMTRDDREAVFLKAGTRALPIVMVDEQYVGDYTRVQELEEAGQLDRILGLSNDDLLTHEQHMQRLRRAEEGEQSEEDDSVDRELLREVVHAAEALRVEVVELREGEETWKKKQEEWQERESELHRELAELRNQLAGLKGDEGGGCETEARGEDAADGWESVEVPGSDAASVRDEAEREGLLQASQEEGDQPPAARQGAAEHPASGDCDIAGLQHLDAEAAADCAVDVPPFVTEVQADRAVELEPVLEESCGATDAGHEDRERTDGLQEEGERGGREQGRLQAFLMELEDAGRLDHMPDLSDSDLHTLQQHMQALHATEAAGDQAAAAEHAAVPAELAEPASACESFCSIPSVPIIDVSPSPLPSSAWAQRLGELGVGAEQGAESDDEVDSETGDC